MLTLDKYLPPKWVVQKGMAEDVLGVFCRHPENIFKMSVLFPAEKNVSQAPDNPGNPDNPANPLEEGGAEDELSPEEIQMVRQLAYHCPPIHR